MGVPALFRWLSQKYSKIISPVVEEQPQIIDGQEVPIDTARPNPNGEEFDNLYLDMNGIVHPCSHPEDRPPPSNEEEMMLAVFKYTDRVVNMVRPRKLLMIAVDGVAPRAKQNQQRSRRFRSAQEAKEKDEDKQELLKMLKTQNGGILKDGTEDLMQKKTWDTNVITPGTPFMNTLAICLRYWCAHKVNTDPAWENVKIILSDASVPGEGEHKIMEFIRSQRSSPEHDPNTRHVIYGLDADLIMLGLATHEPHFRVLREDVFFQESKARTCRICGQKGHIADACKGEVKQRSGEYDEKDDALTQKPFIWLHVSVLREYLEAELRVPEAPFFDLERALDDWVFMCFFVGNDFLPHLPSLDIRENGIDTLIAIWRDNLPLMGGYLTRDGHVDLERAQYVLDGLAKQEDAIFRRRRQTEEKRDANAKRRKLEEQNRTGSRTFNGLDRTGSNSRRKSPDYGASSSNGTGPPPDLPLFASGKGEISKDVEAMTHEMAVNRGAVYKANLANKSAAAALKGQLFKQSPPSGAGSVQEMINADGLGPKSEPQGGSPGQQHPLSALGKRKADLIENDEPTTPSRNTPTDSRTSKADDDEAPPDNVRLWEEGYADRYYEQKFGADPKDIAFRNKVAQAYVEGLAWVLLYYFQGCPSWTWYYPYHYAPFAADFVDLDKTKVKFDRGVPYKPYEQLMGVLPAASNHAIPEVFRSLMSDEESEIIDFYPTEFPIDLNGKKFAWQGVALLPFIDMKRLLMAMDKRYPLLTAEEMARNKTGNDVLIFSDRHRLYDEITSNFYSKRQGDPRLRLRSKISEGLSGDVEKDPEYTLQSPLIYPLENGGMPTLEEDHSISVRYDMPRSKYLHKSMLLRGVKLNAPMLDRADIEATKARANRSGRSYGGALLRGGNGHDRERGNVNYASSRPNPFAEYVTPGFVPPGVGAYPPGNGVYRAGGRSFPPQGDWRGPSKQRIPQASPGYNGGYPQGYVQMNQAANHGHLGYVPPPPPQGYYNGNRPNQ